MISQIKKTCDKFRRKELDNSQKRFIIRNGFKALTKKQVEAERSKAYEYIF